MWSLTPLALSGSSMSIKLNMQVLKRKGSMIERPRQRGLRFLGVSGEFGIASEHRRFIEFCDACRKYAA
jgi:hypothetical protein